MPDLETLFENIMTLNRWSGDESRSGPGSTLLYTCTFEASSRCFSKNSASKVCSTRPAAIFTG